MSKTKRIKYNTPVNFPATFTLRELRKANQHKIKYITLYTRVQKGLENGTLVEAGLKDPDKTRRGRKEVVYQLASSTTAATVEPEVTTAEVAVPATVNW